MTGQEIVQALRRTSTPGGPTGDCEKCPYRKTEQLTAEQKEKLGVDAWTSCDIDKVGTDAADLIERLTAENAALREKQRWISVTEKTPEYDMPQLALNADGDALIANYAYGEWFDTWGQDVEVTHWMPLPEEPKFADILRGAPEAPGEGDKHE